MRKKTKAWLGIFLPITAFMIYSGFSIISDRLAANSLPDPEQQAVQELRSSLSSYELDQPSETGVETAEDTKGKVVDILNEEAFMQDLHKMTHQKVYASPKWGTLAITEERVDLMLQIVEQADYEHGTFYKDALIKWADGDFTNAVEVHNWIWELQDGTIGKAERLLTPEEEAGYIEQYLR